MMKSNKIFQKNQEIASIRNSQSICDIYHFKIKLTIQNFNS